MTEDFVNDLLKQHYSAVDFEMSTADLNRIAENFLKFLLLPDDIKRQLHFPATRPRASADGYTDKTSEVNKDAKQFFHWHPDLENQPECQRLIRQIPEVERLFYEASTLYVEIEKSLLIVFDEFLPEHKNRVFHQGKLRDGTLRFLCYSATGDKQMGASGHYDKGFGTLALADSAPGLRIGCCDHHKLQEVVHREGKALFMPAWMLYQTSAGKFKPAWHDVVGKQGRLNVSENCARWSIVFFINASDDEYFSWEKMHTPLH